MERRRALAIGIVAMVVAVAAVVFGVLPVLTVERGLRMPPVPESGVVTEDVRRSDDDCGALVCTQRIRVYAVNRPASEICEFYADRLAGDVEVLAIGDLGVARCGWIVSEGDLIVGVIVEDAPTGTEVVLSARLTP
jgi:hypothetical protein